MHLGAYGIEKLAEEANKRTKLSEKFLQVERQHSMVNLFSMPGTDPQMRTQFLQLTQQSALRDLEMHLLSAVPSRSANAAPLAPRTREMGKVFSNIATNESHSEWTTVGGTGGQDLNEGRTKNVVGEPYNEAKASNTLLSLSSE